MKCKRPVGKHWRADETAPAQHGPTWRPIGSGQRDIPFGSTHVARRLQGLHKLKLFCGLYRYMIFNMRLQQPSLVAEWSTLTRRTWATSRTGRNGLTNAQTWSNARNWSNCSRSSFPDASTSSVKEFVMENRRRSWRLLCRLPTSTW